MLICRRHTIVEAKYSVDRLHALIEKCYNEMTYRVQALEALNIREDNVSGMLEDDTGSLATIHQHRHDADPEEMMESGLDYFDFSDELQRSRVYRRNQAFRKSVISALTNSVYSLGRSFFSDLSMAEVSNISVINLVITEGEVFNPGRSTQTWSARPDGVVSTNDNVGGQHTQSFKISHEPVQAETSAATARAHSPASTQTQQQSPPQFDYPSSPTFSIPVPHRERLLATTESLENSKDPDSTSNLSVSEVSHPLQAQETSSSASPTFSVSAPHGEGLLGGKKSSEYAENLDPRSSLSQTKLSGPLSPSQTQSTSSPESHDRVEDHAAPPALPKSSIDIEEDEAAYPCKGCGEVYCSFVKLPFG